MALSSLSPVQAALGVALAGSVLAVGVPAFVRDLHASRLAEPVEALGRLTREAASHASGKPPQAAFPESAPLTPAAVPRGERVLDPPGTWSHPTWRALAFEWTVPHRYSFAVDTRLDATESRLEARAHGDLDGDGVLSTLRMGVTVRSGESPTVGPLEVEREVE